MGVVPTPEMPFELASGMCERLSHDGDLRLPFSLTGESGSRSVTQEAKQLHLRELLSRDPSIFLERYGSQLSDAEINGFQCLSGDYEVNFYLQKLLRANTTEGKASEEMEKKNRRLAMMHRMVAAGEYFEMTSMKRRAPLLYHQYMGSRPEKDSAPPGSNATTLWESLLDNLDEADHQQKVKEQLSAQSVARQAQSMQSMSIGGADSEGGGARFGQMDDDLRRDQSDGSLSDSSMEETETEEKEKEAEKSNDGNEDGEGSDGVDPEGERESAMEEFLWVMKERFLRGDDAEFVDYSAIDNDASLDDDWQEQQKNDMEEKYFDED
ncbi:hypothetical protein BSKO_09427 [Bryopsis sp. KO-2023]|nr:hypothetical protein BSKO_09427 [Bryopsis sp. KO-2023]